jgi:hypothetical protein
MNTTNFYAEYAWDDPIYKVMRRETASPRFKLFLLEQKSTDLIFYQYTDMLALRNRSGENFDKLLREHRNFLVREGVETDANQEIARHFSQDVTQYKDLEEEDYHYGKLWCG